jgi:zona occludens toxin (predicted ATPase)
MKRTVWIAAVLIVLVLGIGWYALRSRVRHASGGDASISQQSGDQTKPTAPEATSTGPPTQRPATSNPPASPWSHPATPSPATPRTA